MRDAFVYRSARHCFYKAEKENFRCTRIEKHNGVMLFVFLIKTTSPALRHGSRVCSTRVLLQQYELHDKNKKCVSYAENILKRFSSFVRFRHYPAAGIKRFSKGVVNNAFRAKIFRFNHFGDTGDRRIVESLVWNTKH